MTIRNMVIAGGMLTGFTIGAAAQPKIEHVAPAYTSPSSGIQMFTEYCAVCHGKSGKGDGPGFSALKKAPADLTQLSAENGGKFPEARIRSYIAGADTVAAHGTREMPVWGSIFHSMNENQPLVDLRVSNLTDYVKALQAK